MTTHIVDGVEILLWPHSGGFGAFAAPWSFDLWFDKEGKGSIDVNRTPLGVADYCSSIDRYRALDGPAKARILKAAVAARNGYRGAHPFEQYLVRSHEPGLGKEEFLPIVAAFIHSWRRSSLNAKGA